MKALPAEVSAEIDESKNEIRIKTRNVERLTVFCDGREIDLSREVRIILNNKEVFSGIVEPSASAVLETIRTRLDPALSFGASVKIEAN